MPRLDGLTQLKFNAVVDHGAVAREAELMERRKPGIVKGVTGAPQVFHHIMKIGGDVVRQHKAVMQLGAPAHQLFVVGCFPEPCDQRAQQQHLRQAHLRMRRHFETAELEQAEAAGASGHGVELVDAELGTVRITGEVDEKIAQQLAGHFRRNGSAVFFLQQGHLLEGNFQFIEVVVAGLIDAGRLAGRTDEHAGEQV